jgi:hypothetical protein
MKVVKWPAIHIPAEADPETWRDFTRTPAEAQEDACAQALIMRAGGYESALRILKRNREWRVGGLKHDVDDRILLDIAHCEQVNTGCSDNAALTKVANQAYRGKAAAAALRRLRDKLRGGKLHHWWKKRWSRFVDHLGETISKN